MLRRQIGQGTLILSTYPLEAMAAASPRVNPDATVALYNALAVHAGVRRPVSVPDPDVACDVLVHEDGTRYAVITSHSAQEVAVKPALGVASAQDMPVGLAMLGETGILDQVTLPPFGIEILKILDG